MQIRIKSYEFHLTEPFTPGTVITRGEAQALNGLRAENIQDAVRKLVNQEIERLQPDELIPADRLETLREKISAYDREYKFTERHNGRVKLGSIEAEARQVARERVEAAASRLELDLSSEELERQIALHEKLPSVEEEARQRVQATRRVLNEGLSDL